ncbi:hypothetical protein TNCV_2687991 [Trichonephila clavipes]|nr:hypothetical protein TNCV_2687991 [Trichonephila clavipes]
MFKSVVDGTAPGGDTCLGRHQQRVMEIPNASCDTFFRAFPNWCSRSVVFWGSQTGILLYYRHALFGKGLVTFLAKAEY